MAKINNLKKYDEAYNKRNEKINEIAIQAIKFVEKELAANNLESSNPLAWEMIDLHRRHYGYRFSGCSD